MVKGHFGGKNFEILIIHNYKLRIQTMEIFMLSTIIILWENDQRKRIRWEAKPSFHTSKERSILYYYLASGGLQDTPQFCVQNFFNPDCRIERDSNSPFVKWTLPRPRAVVRPCLNAALHLSPFHSAELEPNLWAPFDLTVWHPTTAKTHCWQSPHGLAGNRHSSPWRNVRGANWHRSSSSTRRLKICDSSLV